MKTEGEHTNTPENYLKQAESATKTFTEVLGVDEHERNLRINSLYHYLGRVALLNDLQKSVIEQCIDFHLAMGPETVRR